MGIRPPGINRYAKTWDDLSAVEQSHILAFSQLKALDDTPEPQQCPLINYKKRS